MKYKSIIMGLSNYYIIARNTSKLEQIKYILTFSCAHTLAAKYKTSIRSIFKKYGKHINITVGKKFINLNYEIEKVPKTYIPIDPFAVTNYTARTKFMVDQPCRICGSPNEIEIHHIRHLKDLNPKLSTVHEIMAKLKRKQIPLCRICHDLIHSGKYSSINLKKLI